jgi:hypothetical protein
MKTTLPLAFSTALLTLSSRCGYSWMTATQNAVASVAPELWKKTPSGSISWALTNGATFFWRNNLPTSF